jgi:hypothetical protein
MRRLHGFVGQFNKGICGEQQGFGIGGSRLLPSIGGIMFFYYGKAIVAFTAIGFSVSACAAIFSGTSQEIAVNTNPAGASCKFLRQGTSVAEVGSTPGKTTVQKTKYDLDIVCSKAGYNDGNYINHSGVAGATYADILGGIATGGIAWGIDSASGADNHYDAQVNVTLFPVVGVASVSPAPTETTVTPVAARPVPSPAVAPLPSSSPTLSEPQVAYIPPATSSATFAPLDPGTWKCGINNIGNTSNPFFTIEFTVANDRTISVASYAHAPATIVRENPLTFTAVNPRGSRLTTFILSSDSSMTITGPALNNPNSRFYNEGRCTRI